MRPDRDYLGEKIRVNLKQPTYSIIKRAIIWKKGDEDKN